jgi:hypothetical protein
MDTSSGILAHLGTNTGVAIFIEGRRRDPLTLGAVYCVENHTPLGNIDRRVLEKVIEENLDDENVFISDIP